jgi:hypothetical protein
LAASIVEKISPAFKFRPATKKSLDARTRRDQKTPSPIIKIE